VTAATRTPAEVVAAFLATVRSGRNPAGADEFMAPRVVAHQLSAGPDHGGAVVRSPAEYAQHVEHMLAELGPWTFRVVSLDADGETVTARWRQESLSGSAAIGTVEQGRAVYRVHDGVIVEYWIDAQQRGPSAD
jgi:predicted SnoaL-like aldol condensation-catalyzing enzyme